MEPFWKRKKLNEMTQEEWESLCDGCAKCCLHKLEDEDTRDVYTTNVVCQFLNLETCQCGDYNHRHELNHDCVPLTPRLVRRLKWLPDTCAYRLVSQGKDLPFWHHLVSGDPDMIHRLGYSVRGKVVSEKDVDMDKLEDYVVDVPEGEDD